MGPFGKAMNGHLVADHVKVTGNRAVQGAGVYVTLSAALRSTASFTDSVIVANAATKFGGGIFAYGDVTLDRTAVVARRHYGGGLNMWQSPKSTLKATNVTIGANSGGERRRHHQRGRSDVRRRHVRREHGRRRQEHPQQRRCDQRRSTIFAGAGKTCQVANNGTITSRGFNIEEGTSCLVALASSDRRNVSADGLALLPMDAANEVYWFRLGPPSLARDTGPTSCTLTVDQRNQPRPMYDRCDIGAIEEETVPVPPTPTPTPSPTPAPPAAEPGPEADRHAQADHDAVPGHHHHPDAHAHPGWRRRRRAGHGRPRPGAS